jgi:VCBS repeat-containing protein
VAAGSTSTNSGTAIAGSFGTLTIGANGSYTYVVNQANATVQALNTDSAALRDVFTYTVQDTAGLTSTATITVAVTGANDAPTVANALVDQSAITSSAFSYQFAENSFVDVDNANLTYTFTVVDSNGNPLATQPNWLSLNASTRTFSGTPAANDNGLLRVRVTASDGSLSVSDTFEINVVNPNVAPVADPTMVNSLAQQSVPTVTISDNIDGTTTVAGQTVTYTLKFSEPIDQASLTAEDIVVTNGGTKGTLQKITDTEYEISVTAPEGVGITSLRLADGSYTSAAGVPGRGATHTQTFGSTEVLDVSINRANGPASDTPPTGWARNEGTPDVSNYEINGFGTQLNFTSGSLNGISQNGGEFASFWVRTDFDTAHIPRESLTKTFNTLTSGTNYTVAFEWQKITIDRNGHGVDHNALADFRVSYLEAGAVKSSMTYTSTTLADLWQEAYFTFTASATTGVIRIDSVISPLNVLADNVGVFAAIAVDSLVADGSLNRSRTITGSSTADTLVGGDGNDVLIGAGGADVILAGAGNDTIVLNADNRAQLAANNTMFIDGGSGVNTLRIEGAGQSLDLTNATVAGKLRNFSVIDITGSGNNLLKLDWASVNAITGGSDVASTAVNEAKLLVVNGNSGDLVELANKRQWHEGALESGTTLATQLGSQHGFIAGQDYRAFTLNGVTLYVNAAMGNVNTTTSTSAPAQLLSQAQTVQTLFGPSFTDSDGSTVAKGQFKGVVITDAGTNAEQTNLGVYQWSTDGTNWTSLAAGLSDSSSVFLAPTTMIRFQAAAGVSSLNQHELKARLVDNSGETGTASLANGATAVDASVNGGATAFSGNVITLKDIVSQTPVIVSLFDNVAGNTGSFASGATSNDPTPTLTGTAEAGATVKLFNGTTEIGTTTANGAGVWSFTPTTPQTSGNFNITATATDVAGNVSGTSNTFAYTLDTIAPTVAISSNKTSLRINETATITFTLSENSTDFTLDDVSWTGGTLSNFSGSGASYTATFTPNENSETDSVISIASGAFSDAAGNFNTDGAEANNTVTLATDTLRPTIAITSDKANLFTGQTANITFTLSENSTDFTLDDVSWTGGTLSNFSGSGASYTATFTPTANSTVNGVITVASDKFSDAAGNFNQDGQDANNTVTLKTDTTLIVAITNATVTSAGFTTGTVTDTVDTKTNAKNSDPTATNNVNTKTTNVASTDFWEVKAAGNANVHFNPGAFLVNSFFGLNNNSQSVAQSGAHTFTSKIGTFSGAFSFEYADLGTDGHVPNNKTIRFFDADSNEIQNAVIGANSINGQYQSKSEFKITLSKSATHFTLSGGTLDFYAIDNIKVTASGIPSQVTTTLVNGDTAVSTTPVLNGTVSRNLTSNETVRVFKDGVDIGQATVTGQNWTINATLTNDSTSQFEARVIRTNDGTVSSSSAFELSQGADGVTPLVLDLNSNGIETTTAKNGVVFDIDGDGSAEQTAWVNGGDGFLVLDLNGDGQINSGRELFGAGTLLQNGETAKHGFEALAQHDLNGDGVIDAKDEVFERLQVWVDANQDGKTDAGELRSLQELDITSLSLKFQTSEQVVNGNTLGLLSQYSTADGQKHQLVDVWLSGIDPENAVEPAEAVDSPLSKVYSLTQGANLDLSSMQGQVALAAMAQSGQMHVDMASDSASNTVSLSLADVLSLPSTNGLYQLTLTGAANDQLVLREGEWTDTGEVVSQNGHNYAVYSGSNDATAQLLIDQQMVSHLQHS